MAAIDLNTQKIIRLNDVDTHVWVCGLKKNIAFLSLEKNLLSESEVYRASLFLRELDRERFILSRIMLQKLLSLYVTQDPGEITFTSGAYGKPTLANDNHQVYFNLSHSHDFMVVAITSKSELGVDIERQSTRFLDPSLISTIFTNNEIQMIQQHSKDNHQKLYLQGWTCKEALLKACGIGLSFELKKVNLLLNSQGRFCVSCIEDTVFNQNSWHHHNLMHEALYSISVVSPFYPRVKIFDYEAELLDHFDFQYCTNGK